MKISKAIRNAWRACAAEPGQTGKFLLVEACLTLICLAPLLCLTRRELAPGALAAPALWLLVMLPARMNAAAAMRDALAGGSLCSPQLAETRGYGEKLACGLKRLFFLILWGGPLTALLLVGWTHFSGNVDSFTVLRMLKDNLGGGDYMRGIAVLGAMAAAALLILVLGCAFHSGARHAWAQGDLNRIRGHHGGLMLAWLASLFTLLPLLIALGIVIARYIPAVRNLNGLMMGTAHLPATRDTILILTAGAVLTLPLLPLRSLIPAAFVEGLGEKA